MKSRTSDDRKRDNHLSILELPSMVKGLFERAQRPLLPGAAGPVDLFVRYLRRKPGRGLAVIYHVDETQRGAGLHAHDPSRAVSLTVGEAALEGTRMRFQAAQARQARLETLPSGVLYLKDLDVSVQAFPADASLSALEASCDTRQGSPVFQALETAARLQFGDSAWQLTSAFAEPVRYKPGNRCVIRYQLTLERAERGISSLRNLALFGKVYANAEQAAAVYELQQRLYAEQERDGVGLPFLPRPLGTVEALGLTLHQAAQSARAGKDGATGEPLPTGTQALRPQIVQGRGGQVSEVIVPKAALRAAAEALARLHLSTVSPDMNMLRSGAKDAKRAKERAALIAAYYPAQAEEVLRLGQYLAAHLEHLHPKAYRPAHGGFKPSQLLLDGDQVFIVDFDGFCLADPALDVGYFLAYLRPSGLWQHRPGMRQWFEEAAAHFFQAYQEALCKHDMASAHVAGIKARAALYEAALLFKIATRRVHRLNSPRPQELAAILDEIAACLRTR
jgi:hypothetical protein